VRDKAHRLAEIKQERTSKSSVFFHDHEHYRAGSSSVIRNIHAIVSRVSRIKILSRAKVGDRTFASASEATASSVKAFASSSSSSSTASEFLFLSFLLSPFPLPFFLSFFLSFFFFFFFFKRIAYRCKNERSLHACVPGMGMRKKVSRKDPRDERSMKSSSFPSDSTADLSSKLSLPACASLSLY